MTKGVLGVAALAAALFASCGAAALADPIEVTIAVTVNALSGQHEIGRHESDTFTFAPLPLGEVTLRRGNEMLRVEGLPPIAFNYGTGPNSSYARRTTRISILNGTYRHTFAGGWFAGIGETAYTQHTDYTSIPPNSYYLRDGRYYFIDGFDSEFSRVSGVRLEVGRTVAVGGGRIEFGAALNPSMHGQTYLVIPMRFCSFSFPGPGTQSCSDTFTTFNDPESATQVDGYLRLAHRVAKHGEVLLGVRYINFTAHYSDQPGQLADRNVGWAPTAGYRLRL